jgi:hypothetical protein
MECKTTTDFFAASPACTELEMVTMDWLAQMLRNLLYSIFTVQLAEYSAKNAKVANLK